MQKIEILRPDGEALKAILLVLSCHIILYLQLMLTKEIPTQADTTNDTQTDKMLNKTQLTQEDTANQRQQEKIVSGIQLIQKDTANQSKKPKMVSVVSLQILQYSEKITINFQVQYGNMEQFALQVQQQVKVHEKECSQEYSSLEPGQKIEHKSVNEQFPQGTTFEQFSSQGQTQSTSNQNNRSNSHRKKTTRPIRSRFIIDDRLRQQQQILGNHLSIEEGPPQENQPRTNVEDRQQHQIIQQTELNNAEERMILDNAQTDRLQPKQEEAIVERQIVENVQPNRAARRNRTHTQQLMHSIISDIFGDVRFYTEISELYFELQCDDWYEQLQLMLDQSSTQQ